MNDLTETLIKGTMKQMKTYWSPSSLCLMLVVSFSAYMPAMVIGSAG